MKVALNLGVVCFKLKRGAGGTIKRGVTEFSQTDNHIPADDKSGSGPDFEAVKKKSRD